MRNPVLPRLPLLLAALLCLCFAAIACGDDDDGGSSGESDLEEYFTSLEATFADFAETSNDISAEYPAAFEELDDTQGYYPDLLTEMQATFADIAALEAPAEIASEHQDLVEATQDFYDEVARVDGEVQALADDAAIVAYADTLSTDPDLTRATTAVSDACHALQDIADDSDIEVDLLCGEATDPAENAVLEQYFIAVKDIFDKADTDTAAAQAALDAALTNASFDQQKTAIDTYLTTVEGIFTDTINRMRGLGAPEPVRNEQNNFVGAVEDMVDSSAAFQENLATIADAEHLDARRADFGDEIEEAVGRADAACVQLQRIAEGRDIDVDLGCEG